VAFDVVQVVEAFRAIGRLAREVAKRGGRFLPGEIEQLAATLRLHGAKAENLEELLQAVARHAFDDLITEASRRGLQRVLGVPVDITTELEGGAVHVVWREEAGEIFGLRIRAAPDARLADVVLHQIVVDRVQRYAVAAKRIQALQARGVSLLGPTEASAVAVLEELDRLGVAIGETSQSAYFKAYSETQKLQPLIRLRELVVEDELTARFALTHPRAPGGSSSRLAQVEAELETLERARREHEGVLDDLSAKMRQTDAAVGMPGTRQLPTTARRAWFPREGLTAAEIGQLVNKLARDTDIPPMEAYLTLKLMDNLSEQEQANLVLILDKLRRGHVLADEERQAVRLYHQRSEPLFESVDTWCGIAKPRGWRLPKNGTWNGDPGDSFFIPHNPAELGLQPGQWIRFIRGYPDFGPYKLGPSYFVKGMDGTKKDFPRIYEEIARQRGWYFRGRPHQQAAKDWLESEMLVPHHAGADEIQLIPAALHNSHPDFMQGVRHMGGAAGLRDQNPRELL
jgi:hypothetical protein